VPKCERGQVQPLGGGGGPRGKKLLLIIPGQGETLSRSGGKGLLKGKGG